MDFLTKNIEAIQKHRPLLYRTLSNYFKTKPSPTPLIEDGGFTNIEISTETGAKKFYTETPDKTWLESLKLSKIENARIVIMHGFGLGYHLEKYFSTVPTTVKHTLLVEKNIALFATALKLTDFISYIKRDDVEFFIGVPQDEFKRYLIDYLLNQERLIYGEKIGHFYLSPSLTLDGPYYVSFAGALNDALDATRNAHTAPPEDNFIGLFNIIHNLDRIKKSATIFPLKGKLAGFTGLLIGAGPSLAEHVDQIKTHRDKFIIGCCDAALQSMLSHGIHPDFVTCSERVVLQKYLFENLPKDFHAPLFTLPSLHPEIYANYPGPVVLLGRLATFGNWLWPDLDVNPGLGVSTVTHEVLTYLGCDKIYMLGQHYAFDRDTDAAYTPGVSDYLNNSDAFNIKTLTCEVAGNDGRPIKTKILWKNFLTEIQDYILKAKVPTYYVIDKSRGAAIKHATRLEPAAFWQQAAAFKAIQKDDLLKKLIEAALPDKAEQTRLDNLIQSTRTYLEKIISQNYLAMENISDDFFNSLLTHYTTDDLFNAYPKHHRSWEEKRLSLIAIDKNSFYLFVNCVFGPSHIKSLREREKLHVTKETIVPYLYDHFLKTLEWFHHLGSWAMRLKTLLRD